MTVSLDGLFDQWIQREVESRREHDGAQHPHRVFLKAIVWIANRPDDASVDVVETADVVDDRPVGDVIEQGVDGEVSPKRVFLRRPERVVAVDQQVALGIRDRFVGMAPARAPPQG